jgi:hypothetical protein
MEAGCSSLVRAVAAVRVATVASAKVVGRREDKVRAFHIEVFGEQWLVFKSRFAISGLER